MSFPKPYFLLLVVVLQACVFTPKTHEIYDADCQIYARHATLEHSEVISLGRCKNTECAVALAFAGVVTAASAVISGSIVVVGNTVYWLEKQGRCKRVSSPAELTQASRAAPAG